MTIDLEEVAVALDAFPHWEEQERADIFHAIDCAPDAPLHSFREAEAYYEDSAGVLAWNRIKAFPLEHNNGKRWVLTLDEASGFESAPTKEEIVKALHRAEGMVRS